MAECRQKGKDKPPEKYDKFKRRNNDKFTVLIQYECTQKPELLHALEWEENITFHRFFFFYLFLVWQIHVGAADEPLQPVFLPITNVS